MIKLEDRPLNFNEKIINNWKRSVEENEMVFHLGDFAIWFGPTVDMWLGLGKTLPGNIQMLRGNHDEKTSEEFSKYDIWLHENSILKEIGQTKILFSHAPQEDDGSFDINIHGHIHSNSHRKDEFDCDYEDSKYINISVEVMDYKPWRLRDILDRKTNL